MTIFSDEQSVSFDGSKNILTPLLLLSLSGRSGTTLLMQLLGTSQEIVFDRIYPYEIRYLTYLLRWALLLKDQCKPTSEWNFASSFYSPNGFVGPFPSPNAQLWDGNQMWKQSFLSAWKTFSSTAMGENPNRIRPKYYAEKAEPWSMAYLGEILPYRAILLVRDPRDIFLSINAFDKKRGSRGFRLSRHKWEGSWAFARRFVGLIRERLVFMQKEKLNPQSIVFKYENVITDLSMETQHLEQWLGLKLNAKQVENQRGDFAHHMTSDSAHHSVHRWKREMSPKLNDYFVKELHEELGYFNYEI